MRFRDSEGRKGEEMGDAQLRGATTRDEEEDSMYAIQDNFGAKKGWTDNKKIAEERSPINNKYTNMNQ
jgi:hypothetical protein